MTQTIGELQKGIVEQGVSDHTLSSKIGSHITFCGFEAESRDGAISSVEQILESKWVPHITLASRLNVDEVVKATGWLAANFVPFLGSLDRLAVIDCDTEEWVYDGKLMENH